MNQSLNESAASSNRSASRGSFTFGISAVVIFVLFVLAALMGGEIADRGLLPLVRFISLLMLALAVFTTVTVGRYLAYSPNRWKVGQCAAGCIAIGGGLVWSASFFGVGFILFMTGTLLCALLIFKEMERRNNRRIARMTANS